MIRTYSLTTELIDGAEQPKGIEHIHHAILDIEDTKRKLVQDTTDEEHNALVAVADSWRKATTEEAKQLTDMKAGIPADPARDVFADLDALKARIEVLESK